MIWEGCDASAWDMQGFFEANILTTLTYAEDASSENTTIPQFVVQDVATAIRFASAVAGQKSQRDG